VVRSAGGTFAQGLDHLLSTRLFRNGKVMDATTSAGMISTMSRKHYIGVSLD
jgi:hypothetical protein